MREEGGEMGEIERSAAHLELCAIICFDASRQGSWGVVPSCYKNPTRDGDPIEIKHLYGNIQANPSIFCVEFGGGDARCEII